MKPDIAFLREISGLTEQEICDDDLVRVNELLGQLADIFCDEYQRQLEAKMEAGEDGPVIHFPDTISEENSIS